MIKHPLFKTGTTISNATTLEINYDPTVTFEARFKIVGWKCSQKEAIFESSGALLSQEFLDYAQSMERGKYITLEVNVKGADGIIRKLSGSWVKEQRL